jgi:predicted ester cyclase
VTNREMKAAFVVMWRTAVPDLHYTVVPLTPDDLIGEGDTVVHQVVGRGTHTGELFGIAPTGNTLEWTETHIGRFAHGKLVEHWGQIDLLGLLQHLGAIPVAPVPALAPMQSGAVIERTVAMGDRHHAMSPAAGHS